MDTTSTPEEWRPAVGWQGYIEVSSHGRVRSLTRMVEKPHPVVGTYLTQRAGHLLKPFVKGGKLQLSLSFKNTKDKVSVHSLVAAAFFGPTPEGFYIAARNGDLTDCRSENLHFLPSVPHLPGEIWKGVVGYEDLYLISNMGRLLALQRPGSRGKRRHSPTIRTPTIVNRYLTAQLFTGRRFRAGRIHILVCEAFNGLRPEGMEAAHRDGNRLNNSAYNLYWASPKENKRDYIITAFAELSGIDHERLRLFLDRKASKHSTA